MSSYLYKIANTAGLSTGTTIEVLKNSPVPEGWVTSEYKSTGNYMTIINTIGYASGHTLTMVLADSIPELPARPEGWGYFKYEKIDDQHWIYTLKNYNGYPSGSIQRIAAFTPVPEGWTRFSFSFTRIQKI